VFSHPPGTTIHACPDMQLVPKYSLWLPIPAHNFQIRNTAFKGPVASCRKLYVKLTCTCWEYRAFWERKHPLLLPKLETLQTVLKIATSQIMLLHRRQFLLKVGKKCIEYVCILLLNILGKKGQAELQIWNYYFKNGFYFLLKGSKLPQTIKSLLQIWRNRKFHPQMVIYKAICWSKILKSFL
jgi:hypothetical protein